MIVGQKLFYVPKQSYGQQPEPYEVTVVSVGRKWATVQSSQNAWDKIKIGIESMAADGGQYLSPGACWYSRELWEESIEAKKLWDAFRKEVESMFNPPKQLSLQEIKTLHNRSTMWSTK